MATERELPSMCPECGEILDWSQFTNQSQSQYGPYGEFTTTWNWLYDEVSCHMCDFRDFKLYSCTTK